MATHAPITGARTRAPSTPHNLVHSGTPAPRVPAGPDSLAAKACVVLDFARPVSPSALLADLMDTLATCVVLSRMWLEMLGGIFSGGVKVVGQAARSTG